MNTDTWKCHDLDTAAGPFVKEEQSTTRACRYCGNLISWVPCSYCGADFGPTVCQHCGRRWSLGQRKCWNGAVGCGAKIEQGCVGECRIEKACSPLGFSEVIFPTDYDFISSEQMAKAMQEALDKKMMEMLCPPTT